MARQSERPWMAPPPLLPINDLVRHTDAIRPAIDAAIASVVDSGWFVLGPRVEEFEATFANFCSSAETVGVANGTDAIEIALRAVGAGPGDEVLTVANAGGYSTTAIHAIGAKPIYVDVDPTTLLIDASLVTAAISQRTAAIVVTHLYGRTAPVDRVLALAGSIPVIEDCAQAHGAHLAGQPVGSWGTLGCFSFYPTKNLGALGDAGAIVGSDPGLMAKIRRLRQYGWSDKYHATDTGGRNSRLDELQAAVLNAQLPLLRGWNLRRSEIGAAYRKRILNPRVHHVPMTEGDVMHLAVIQADDRLGLRSHLLERNVGTDIHYPRADYTANSARNERLEHTEVACATVLTLPCFPEMTDDEVERVIAAVNTWPM